MTKRICICATKIPFVRGGGEIHVESLLRELTERGFETDQEAALVDLGRMEQAIEHFKRAVELEPEDKQFREVLEKALRQ